MATRPHWHGPRYTTYYRAPGRPTQPRKSRWVFALVALAMVGVGWLRVTHKQHITADTAVVNQTAKVSQKVSSDTVTDPLLAALTGAWQTTLNTRNDTVQIAVYDSKTGDTVIGGVSGTTFTSASITKLSIAEATLVQDQQDGGGVTAAQLAELEPMLENSDNNAADALWDALGGSDAFTSF